MPDDGIPAQVHLSVKTCLVFYLAITATYVCLVYIPVEVYCLPENGPPCCPLPGGGPRWALGGGARWALGGDERCILGSLGPDGSFRVLGGDLDDGRV